MPTDLNKAGVAQKLAATIKEDIDHYAVEKYSDPFRWHLGASEIGNNCDNYLWLKFRWTFKSNFNGRMLRLFQRGHREEEVFVEYLEGIGCQVFTEDLTNNQIYFDKQNFKFFDNYEEAKLHSELNNLYQVQQQDKDLIKFGKALGFKFPQFRFRSGNSHFGGSKDGVVIFPERYGVLHPVLAEFKTNGTGAGFNKLGKDGMKLAKPMHWSQVCTYGTDLEHKHEHVVYLNVNKNDDDIFVDVVKLDKKLGEKMAAKAERIITSDRQMVKVSLNKTHYECQMCDAKEVCHNGAIPEKNCRSCKFAVAVENGEWACTNLPEPAVIPRQFVYQGCDNWHPVTIEE